MADKAAKSADPAPEPAPASEPAPAPAAPAEEHLHLDAFLNRIEAETRAAGKNAEVELLSAFAVACRLAGKVHQAASAWRKDLDAFRSAKP